VRGEGNLRVEEMVEEVREVLYCIGQGTTYLYILHNVRTEVAESPDEGHKFERNRFISESWPHRRGLLLSGQNNLHQAISKTGFT